MISPDYVVIEAVIAVLGLFGFLVAKYIRDHKKKQTTMVCPVGFDCHSVVHSRYSKFLGMAVESCGMCYYAFVFFAYILFIFWPAILSIYLVLFLILVSLASTVFSAYLIFVQIFILRKGCSWCIVSALISASIFVLTLFIYDLSVITQYFVF